jgi:hypothetical protein
MMTGARQGATDHYAFLPNAQRQHSHALIDWTSASANEPLPIQTSLYIIPRIERAPHDVQRPENSLNPTSDHRWWRFCPAFLCQTFCASSCRPDVYLVSFTVHAASEASMISMIANTTDFWRSQRHEGLCHGVHQLNKRPSTKWCLKQQGALSSAA